MCGSRDREPSQRRAGRVIGKRHRDAETERFDMLWGLLVLLVILWALGFFTIGSSLIHLLLVVALIVLLFNLFSGRRTVA
jgi:hypothetical protein